MVGGDVGDHRDVVAGQPDALEQDAAAGGLGDRELAPRVGQHPAGAARARVVAGLDQLAVDVDAVGVRPADAAGRRRGAMCAIIREVVVLPLVPVTATTGTRGVIVVGAGPARTRRTRAAASLTTASSRRAPGSASSTSATAAPSACARSRWRHGKATTSWCGSLVGPRPARRAGSCPTPVAIARAPAGPTARSANRCRKPGVGRPGRALRSPIRGGEPLGGRAPGRPPAR